MCYWTQEQRSTPYTLPQPSLRQVLIEGRGFDEIHLFSGETKDFAERIFQPLLEESAANGFDRFMLTTSGVLLTKGDLCDSLKRFPGQLHFRPSIDGHWGHDNATSSGRHGDILAKFLKVRDESHRLTLEVNWVHKPNPRNDELKDVFAARCRENGVPFWTSYLSDLRNSSPKWGETVVPAMLGLDHPELNSMVFNHCALPTPTFGNPIKQVQVGPAPIYYLCKIQLDGFAIGHVGDFNPGDLLRSMENIERRYQSFVRLMGEGGIIHVAKYLRETEAREEVDKLLAQPYARNCGGCELCRAFFKFLPQLDECIN